MKTSPFTQFLCCMALVVPIAISAPGLAQDTAAAAKYPLQIRFIDSVTGAAIQPETVTSQPHQPGAVERRLAAGQVEKNGRAALALERGRHTIAAIAPGYQPMSGEFEMSENNPYRIQFLLDPLKTPRELEPEYVASLHRDGLMLIQGFVVDDDSGALLSGVRVRAVPSGLEAGTDGGGFFQFYVPAPSKTETKSAPAGLLFEKPGHQSAERLYVEMWAGGDCTYRIGLLPGKGTQSVDERKGRRQTSESDPLSAAPSAAATAAAKGELVQPLDNATPKSTAATNATIRVPRNIRVLKQDDVTIDYVDMGTYVRCVLPHEWLASWGSSAGMNCLYAGAVAVRSYAISRLNGAGSSSYDICGNSNCQNYDPSVTYSSTDSAANYTANWVMISGGSIASTEYSSENNSLGYSCTDGFTEPSTSGPTCIYDPMCYGTARFGHGRGMCQYGSYRWSIAYRGFPARNWTWILGHYYPTLTLVKGAPLMVGDDVKARTSLDVRACADGSITSGAGCALVTTKSAGATGTIVVGPTRVTSDGYGFTWYQVQWSDSTVGWSVENYLERVYSVPAVPTNLTATALWTNQINLSWQDAAGGTTVSFSLERANATGGPWRLLNTLAASVTNYSDLNLYSGSTWYYRVRAYNAAGYSGYSATAGATTSSSPPVMAAIPSRTITATTTLCFTNSVTAPDLAQFITDFETFMSETANGLVMFRTPLTSASTSANLGAPTTASSLLVTPNVAAVTDTYPTTGHGAGRVLKVSCQFVNANNPWLQLTTAGAANFPNPVIDITKKLRFDIYADQAIKVAVGCRETTTPVGTALGSDGGVSGGIVWAGVTNVAGSAPMPTRTVAANNWTTLTFDLPNEPIQSYPSGGTSVLSTASGLGVLEHLAIVPAAGIGVYNIYLDNFVLILPRTFTWSLGSLAPAGASINPTTGVFTWTPTAAQAGTSGKYYTVPVIVTDSSSPPFSVTNVFVVKVNLVPIDLTTPTNNAVFAAPATIDLLASVITNGNTINHVSFYNGGTLLSNVTTSPYACSWTAAAPGTYSLWAQAVYNGGSTTNSATNTVFVINSSPSTTVLTGSGSPTSYGATVTFTATVTGSAPTGTIQLQDGGVNLGSSVALSGGQAQIGISTLSVPGSPHAITAVYSGNITNRSSTSSAVSQTINPITSATLLATSLNPSAVGSNVIFTATVRASAGTPAGNVVFLANNTPFSTNALLDGQALVSTVSLPVGTNTISAQYATQDNYLASNKSRTQVVVAPVSGSPTNVIVGIADNLDGSFTLTFQGVPGAQYCVLANLDSTAPMNTWTPLPDSTNTASSPSGQWSFIVSVPAPQYFRSMALTP